MAKVTGPLMSMDARGALGKAIVFSNWKGVAVVRQFVIPSNPNTAAQQSVRAAFSSAVEVFKTLSAEDKTAWGRRASGLAMSGYNALVKYCSAAIQAGKTWVTINNVNEGAAATNSTITVEVTTDALKACKVEYGTKTGVYTATKEEVADPGDLDPRNIVLTGLAANTLYFFRVSLKTPGGTHEGATGEYTAMTAA